MTQPVPQPQALRLDARVPRYTSYPPATAFSDAVGPDTYAMWLRGLDPARPISLYVHIPFCRRLCYFCACRTQGTKTAGPVDRYLDHLEQEIAMVAALPQGRLPVRHLHLGGGTPTLLTPDQLARLGTMLRAAFDILEDAEIAVEIDPTELDDARLDALAAFGMTRASIGVQDFDPAVQAAIGREQTVQQTQFAVQGLRARGITSLNIDLLFGLPHQTTATLRTTLDTIRKISPDRIALYGYAHVPWAAARQRMIPTEALPETEARLGLFETARKLMQWAGFEPVGIDHFAKPGDGLALAAADGTLRRNFQGYTTDVADTLIGLGASALSRNAKGHAQNISSTATWQARVAAGVLPTARGHSFSSEDIKRGRIIEDMMCQFSSNLTARTNGDEDLRARLSTTAASLAAALPDHVSWDGTTLRLITGDGRYARLAAAAFDTFYQASETAFSKAL